MVDLTKYPKRATPKQAAEILGFSVYAINQLCTQGVLPYVQIGRRKYILMDFAEAALEAEAFANQEKQKKALEDSREQVIMQEVHLGKNFPKIKELI